VEHQRQALDIIICNCDFQAKDVKCRMQTVLHLYGANTNQRSMLKLPLLHSYTKCIYKRFIT